MKPAAQLQSAIRRASPDRKAAIIGSSISPRLIERAAFGRPINASDHLRLCALLGLDPQTGKRYANWIEIGPLHYPSLSAALRMKRIQDRLNLRVAARRAKLSYSALGRTERGEPVGIEAILAACKWLNRHPYEFALMVGSHSRSAA